MAIGLIGVGSALVDQLAHVPEAFLEGVSGAKGGMELIDSMGMLELVGRLPAAPTRAPGGSAANTVVGVARLGLQAGFLSKVGADAAGVYYRDAVVGAGVDGSRFKISADTPTGSCISLITPDSERTMRTYLGASATLASEDISAADFAGYSHAHIEGYLLFDERLMMQVLGAAREAGCRIALDLAAREVVLAARPLLPRLLERYVDIVFANEDEAAALCGPGDEAATVNALAGFCEVAAVKMGARGALIARDGATVHVQAPAVTAVDTTGAGDLWAAGFLYGLMKGWSLEAAGNAGAAVAAAVVQVTGAALPADTWAALSSAVGKLAPNETAH